MVELQERDDIGAAGKFKRGTVGAPGSGCLGVTLATDRRDVLVVDWAEVLPVACGVARLDDLTDLEVSGRVDIFENDLAF